jgi:tetratricopeptide (TPR) repeat protein
LLVVLVALAAILNWFPQIQNNSLIIAGSILATAIELYGFVKDRKSKNESQPGSNANQTSSGPIGIQQQDMSVQGPQTNIADKVHGDVFSGKFDGPVASGGEAVDLRGSTEAIYKPIIQQREKPPVPSQIPAKPNDFIGRNEELNDLLGSFDHGGTITGLRGLGGVGKTALALVLADRLKGRFPDGQIFINLLGTSKDPLNPANAMAHVIRSFLGADARLPEDPGELAGLYRSVLSGKRTLILLDNAASRVQVEPLLPPVGSALLITSRNKFALPGLKEKDLDVLPLDDAKKLLLEVAARIGGHAGELAELCGCLPLALRNAAYALAEMKNLNVADYVERLKDARKRLDLVEASFSMSYELLTLELQRLWCLLSVFPADFDRAGAAAVWEMEPGPAEEALGELVKWSLVYFLAPASGEVGRYRLHDLARVFADSRLGADAHEPALQRHAKHYQELLWKANELFLRGGDTLSNGLIQFDTDWANIQTGQEWAKINAFKSLEIAQICSNFAETGPLLCLRLHPLMNIEWLEAALVASRKTENQNAEGNHLGNLGTAYFLMSETCKAINYYEQALKTAREIGDRWGEEAYLGNLGSAYFDLEGPRKSVGYYDQALKISRDIGDRQGEGTLLGNLGNVHYHLHEPRKAIEYYEQALKIAREIGDRWGEGTRLGNQGLAYYLLDETRKAIECYEQALKISREIGDRRGEGNHRGNLGNAYANLGEPNKAIEYCEHALQISREIGDRRSEGNNMGNLGNAHLLMGETSKAVNYYEQALKVSHEIGDSQGEGNYLGKLALVHFGLGEKQKAQELARSAYGIFKQI